MKVLIFGLGAYPGGSGSAAALYYAKHGHQVRVTDLKTAAQLHQPTLRRLASYKNVSCIFGKHRRQDIAWAEIIIRNPGVPDNHFIQYAHQLHKTITNDVGVFLHIVRERYSSDAVPIIAVTGTRGKSTTTSLITAVLRAQFGPQRVHCGGNIGQSPLLFLHKIKAGDMVVLELSSWLLRDLHNPGFRVAVITNLLRDHMNYYPNMLLYQRDKERIVHGQTTADYAVIKTGDRTLQQMVKHTPARIIQYSAKHIPGSKIIGQHNDANIGAAWAVGQIFDVPAAVLTRAIKQFSGVPNRLEKIRVHKQRTFYNDTTATTPDATIAALQSFSRKVILIAGGNSKRLSLTALRRIIRQRVKQLILLPGNANHDFPPGIEVTTMIQAVHTAWNLSQPGDIILLSPGVTWLPVMNEFERGKQFMRAVKALR